MFAYSQTRRIFSIFFKFTLLLPITKPLCPQFQDYVLVWGTVCVKLLHRQTSMSLMLRHLLWFLSNMLLEVSALETVNSQQCVHDYML